MTTIEKDKRLERDPGRMPRVVVAGAGFGGLAAVRRLTRTGFRTTLIDRNVYATFQPLLYQVATELSAGPAAGHRASARPAGVTPAPPVRPVPHASRP